MTNHGSRNPITWEDYHHGAGSHRGSQGSIGSHGSTNEDGSRRRLLSGHRTSHDTTGSTGPNLRERRSSISVRFDALRHAGGVNSIENFARSWQRAAGFFEVAPQAPSLVLADDDDVFADPRRSDVEHVPATRSLLRDELEAEQGPSEEQAVGEREGDEGSIPSHDPARRGSKRGENNADEIFRIAPHLASPFGASYGTSYGSFASHAADHSMAHAGHLWRQQQETGVQQPDKEREPLLVKRVEREDGKVVNVVVGQSTLPQTIFNSVNVLIGVGLLSLPLAVRYAGWLVGMTFLVLAAAVTSYTATILAKCLDVDETLITFADLAYISFGSKARIITSVIFGLELLAANVALVVLFADSLSALIPAWGPVEWKIVCGLALLPLGFLPLWVLSFSSVLGILSCFSIVAIIFIDGLIKPHAPGSLREPAKTYLWPENWSMLPLAIGLLMSPWGGHSVFPNIYRDMRHPKKFNRGLTITYTFTLLLDIAMALAGVLMFGEEVRNEITSNILERSEYPRALSICVVVFIAIIPLTKIPLNARPIVSTIEVLAGLDPRAVSNAQALVGQSGFTRGILKVTIRVVTTIIFVIIAIIFPSFDSIMALLGSAFCFTICIILPLAFYLRIFGNEIPLRERIFDYVLIVVSSILAILGTIWAVLPRKIFGPEE
ncbi:MAG: hypothetical protein M1823_003459 [Watsoniomyces obsoletus]|nr:MAG: hypothetical protein M1823_003459 [Watsoniomyces obsoletus]